MLVNNYHQVMPKTMNYATNGSGRDTYISWDNGGTFCPSLKNPGHKRGMGRPASAIPQGNARSLHYTSDGSGRDSYIKRGDGGLHNYSTGGSFVGTLRTYSRLVKDDQYTRAHTSWIGKRLRGTLRERGQIAAQCVNRLYPKQL